MVNEERMQAIKDINVEIAKLYDSKNFSPTETLTSLTLLLSTTIKIGKRTGVIVNPDLLIKTITEELTEASEGA